MDVVTRLMGLILAVVGTQISFRGFTTPRAFSEGATRPPPPSR